MDVLRFFTPSIQRWTQQLSVHAPCYFLSHTPLISFWRPPPLLSCLTCSSFCPVAEELISEGGVGVVGALWLVCVGAFLCWKRFPAAYTSFRCSLNTWATCPFYFKKKRKEKKNGGCQLQHLLMNQCGISLPPLGFTYSTSNSLSLLFIYEYSLREQISHTVRAQQWMLNHWFDSGPFTLNGS